MAMRKRSGSGSKRHMKEKVVQIYESFFKREDLISDNPSFWDEFFLLKPKIPQLEEEINKLTTEQLMNMKDNLNLLVIQGIEMLGQEHHMRRLYALQTLSAVFVTMYQKVVQDQLLNIKILLFGENADENMQKLLEYCNQVLSGDGPDSAKAMMLKLMLVIVTGFDSIDENPLVEYFVIHPIFDSLVKLLCTTNERQQHGTDVVTLLMFLVNYKKQEPVVNNIYVVKLSILDNEFALTGYGQVINLALNDFVTTIFTKLQNNNNAGSGWLSSLTSMVGGIFLGGDETQIVGKSVTNSGDESMLLALYEIAHINRNFMATLGHAPASASAPPSPPSTLPHHQNPPDAAQIEALVDNNQPTNLLFTFFQHCSIVLADTKENNINKCTLCLITLTCIVEEQFANSMMHDQNLSFKVQLYKKPMRHRKSVLEEPRSQPLASTLIDLVVEFLKCHLSPKEFPGALYSLCVGVLQRVLCYQRRARVRLARDWRPLWAALIALVKFLIDNEPTILPNCNIFVLSQQIVNIFNLFITFGDTFLPTPIAYDLLYYELIRMSDVFDSLSQMAHRVAMSDGEYKQDALRLANSLVNVRAIGHHFTIKITDDLTNKGLSTPSEDDILEVVRKNYDSLILKLQEGLEGFEQYSDDEYRTLLEQLRLRATRDVRRNLASALLNIQRVSELTQT